MKNIALPGFIAQTESRFCYYCLESAVVICWDTLQADWKLTCHDAACYWTPETALWFPTGAHLGCACQPCPSKAAFLSLLILMSIKKP